MNDLRGEPSRERAPRELWPLLWRTAQLFFSRVFGAVLTYALQILLARWLGADQLGVYLHAFAVCVLVSNFALAGLGAAAMRFVAQALARAQPGLIGGFVRRSRGIVLGLGLLLGGATCAFAAIREPDWAAAAPLFVAGLAMPVYALLRLQAGIGHALSWFVFWNLPNNVLRPLLLVLGVVALRQAGWLGHAGDVMVLHAAIIGALYAGQSLVFSRGMVAVTGSAPPQYATRTWLRTALPLMMVSTFTAFYPEVNLVVAEPFLSKGDLAVFNVAYRTVVFLGLLMMAIDNSQLPRISKLMASGDLAAVRALVRRNSRVKCAGVAVGAVVLALFGRHVLGLFGDPHYLTGEPLLWVLAGGYLARAVIGPAGEVLSISGHQDRCVVVYGVGLLATALLAWLWIPRYGVMGASLTVATVMIACDLVLHGMAWRRLGLRLDLFAPHPGG